MPEPSRPNRQRTGAAGEELAVAHLRRQGYTILARNWRVAAGELRGELDIVALDRGVAVFVEVKARCDDRFGGPLVAVTARKQRQVRALAAEFLRSARLRARAVRFDVVGVWLPPGEEPQIEHVRGAFT